MRRANDLIEESSTDAINQDQISGINNQIEMDIAAMESGGGVVEEYTEPNKHIANEFSM